MRSIYSNNSQIPFQTPDFPQVRPNATIFGFNKHNQGYSISLFYETKLIIIDLDLDLDLVSYFLHRSRMLIELKDEGKL